MGTIRPLSDTVKPLDVAFRTVHYGDISYKRARDCVYAAIGYDYVDSVHQLDADVSYYCDTRSLWSGALGVYWTPSPFYRDAAIVAVRQLIADGRAYGDHPLLYRSGLGSRGCAGRICSMVEVDDRTIAQQIQVIDAIEALVGPTYSTVIMSGDGRPSARAAIEAIRTTTHRIEHVEGKSLHVYATHPEIVPDDLAAEIHRYHVAILGGDPSIGDVARRMRRPSTIATEYTTDGALRARVQTTLRAEPIIIPATEYLDRLRRVASHYGIDVEQAYTEAVQAHRASRSIGGAGGSADTVDQGWVDPRTIVRDSTGREIRLCDLAARIPVGGSEQVFARPDNVRTPSATAYRDDEWISVYDHRTRERWYTSVTTLDRPSPGVTTPPIYIYTEGGGDTSSSPDQGGDTHTDDDRDWCPPIPPASEAPVVLLTRAMGYGKSTRIAEAAARYERVTAIAPGICLTLKLAEDLDLDHYQSIEGTLDQPRMAVCTPSLCRRPPQPGALLVIDEAEDCMAMMHNRGVMTVGGVDRRGVTWEDTKGHVAAAIRGGGQVIIADAYLSDATRADVRRLCAGLGVEPVELGHREGYLPHADLTIEHVAWEGQVIEAITRDVQAGQPIAVTCHQRLDVEAYAEMIRSIGGEDYPILEIHSESEEEAKKSLARATETGGQYRAILYNLAAGSGISWEMEGYRSYYIGRPVRGITYNQMLQAMSRLRHPEGGRRMVWLPPTPYDYECDATAIREREERKAIQTGGYLRTWTVDEHGHPTMQMIGSDHLDSMIDRIIDGHYRAQDASDKAIARLREQGARVIWSCPQDVSMYERLEALHAETRKAVKEAKVDAALAAPVKGSAYIREIRAKPAPSREERAEIVKHTSVNRWGRAGETETYVRDTMGQGRRNRSGWRLGSYIATISDRDSLAAVRGRTVRGATSRGPGGRVYYSAAQLSHAELESRAVAAILDTWDFPSTSLVDAVHPYRDRSLRTGGEWTVEQRDATRLGGPLHTWEYHQRDPDIATRWERIIEIQGMYDVAGLLGVQDPRDVTEPGDMIRWLGTVLTWVGIPRRKPRRLTRNGGRCQVYRVDYEAIERIAETRSRQIARACGVEVETVDEMYPQVDVTTVVDAIIDGTEPEPIAVVDLDDDDETSIEPVEPETTWTTAEGTPIYEIPAPVWDVQDGTVLQLSPDGRRGVYLRSDGIVTYVLPRAEHDAWMRQLADRASQVDDETLVEHWHRYAEERGVEVEWREAV